MYEDAVAALGHEWMPRDRVHEADVPRSEERRYNSALVPTGGGVPEDVAVGDEVVDCVDAEEAVVEGVGIPSMNVCERTTAF